MDNKEYENKYSGTVKVLRVIGWILLPIGLICMITGMASFFMSIGNPEGPKFFFLCFVGAPFIFGGIVCLSLGYHRKMGEFVATQTAPVAKDFTNYMIDGTSDSVAKAVGKVIKEAKTDNGTQAIEGVTANTCSKCGHVNPANAQFYAKCGAPLTRVCPHCGTVNDDGAKFCNKCGHELY